MEYRNILIQDELTGITMFATNKIATKKIEEDQYIKVSSLMEDNAILNRRKTLNERRLPLERRKAFSSLYAGDNKRDFELEQRRKAICRRDIDQRSHKTKEKIDNLELNAASINSLIEGQMHIVKKMSKLLPFKNGLGFCQADTIIRMIYDDIKSLMQKEEYLLCLYLKTNNDVLSKLEIDRLLSIINNDISQLSDELMEMVGKYYIAKINETNFGFVQLDMNTVREKIIICLYKKKKHLYPIYIK